ncbi:MAG: shikimate dehydrogenase [Bacteroidota bacterium]|nr:shikimate dehydrogenase [Bacteroidota bacterium]
MKIYGLIGNPLIHSFSQKYFAEKFSNENIKDCSYQNFQTNDLDNEIRKLKTNPSLYGLNVTIPYKSQIIPFLDIVSKECDEIGACNCIKIHNEKWIGFNTDILGFEKTFTRHLKPHNKKALILGTGGSSKAVAYILRKLNMEYLFVSRDKKSESKNMTYSDITLPIIQEYNVVINTTPLGMFPDTNGFPELPYQYISNKNYFFDLIYNPKKTIFLSKAEAMGATIENGEDMLEIQAEESWKIWNQN